MFSSSSIPTTQLINLKMPDSTGSSSESLSATYKSSSGTKTFAYALSAPKPDDNGALEAQAKSKYLSELRDSSKRLQEDINKFLTEKMEEDKKAAGQDSQNGAVKQKSRDELEEEHYGGEEVDEDEGT